MKTEFKAKFLQHLNQKKQEKGFTLIELLVVVIIIGILAAVALPSLLSQTNKAKQAEARQNVGAMNRAQQAYYLERQQFASSLTDLAVGIKTQTENFKYEIATVGNTGVLNRGTPIKENLKAYTGLVYTTGGTGESLTLALMCESTNTTTSPLNIDTATPKCEPNGKDLGK